jgi:hypothetical protein
VLNLLWKRARYIAKVARGRVVCNGTRVSMAQRLDYEKYLVHIGLYRQGCISKIQKEASKNADNCASQQRIICIKIILVR